MTEKKKLSICTEGTNACCYSNIFSGLSEDKPSNILVEIFLG